MNEDRGSYYPRIRVHPAALPAWVSVAIIVTIFIIVGFLSFRYHGGL